MAAISSKKLSFRTTYKGEEFASEIVFDI
ncbi:hypothetical protein LEA_00348, partial [human gut metagenome]